MFMRKRDPRYKAYTARQAKSTEQPPTAPASGTTTPRRPAPTSTFVAQDWQKVAEPSDAAADLEWARAEGAEDEEWECIACNKTFRSEAAWSSHERSKKHLRAVEQLKREMQDEELELDLGQGGDKVTDADVKDQDEVDEDPLMAGADVTVEGSGGDNDPPEATPDRKSGPIPKEEGDATEGEGDVSPRRPGRQHRTQKTAHTSSSPSPTPPPAPKTARKGRARAARGPSRQQQMDGDLAFSEENRETSLTPGESHHVRNGSDEDDGAGTANSAKGESLSKREKRRAREAAKKAHESEAKSGCAVSLLDPILSHISTHFNSRARAMLFFFFFGFPTRSRIPGWSVPLLVIFWLNLTLRLIEPHSVTFVGKRSKAGQNCSNTSTARAMHWQIRVTGGMYQRKKERRRSQPE